MSRERTLQQRVNDRDNDYSPLEERYSKVTGDPLVRDPYTSVRHPLPHLTLSASIIIPAYNSASTLHQCLLSIEQSSFNRKYPGQLEAIVVDGGSTDNTWILLQRLELNLRLKVAQQADHVRAHSRNTALAMAEGDVIICCDPDMILTPFSIEELMKRHQLLEHALLIGFRTSVSSTNPRIQPAALSHHLPGTLPQFFYDRRLHYPGRGWSENLCAETDHLKHFGNGKLLLPSNGCWQNLPLLVYGTLCSMRRSDFIAMGGFDERLLGWGCEDTLVGARAIALGNYIIPVYSAVGLHISHDQRPRQWQEYAENSLIYHTILHAPFHPHNPYGYSHAKSRIHRYFERQPAASAKLPPVDASFYEVFDSALADPYHRGQYLFALGRYREAADAFFTVRGTAEEEARSALARGKALRLGGSIDDAVTVLHEASAEHLVRVPSLIELALALAAQSRFVEASTCVKHAQEIDPTHPLLPFLSQEPRFTHQERAALYTRQAFYELAARAYETALLCEPHSLLTGVKRAQVLNALGDERAAQEAYINFLVHTPSQDLSEFHTELECVWSHIDNDEYEAAQATLEELRRCHPSHRGLAQLLNEVSGEALKRLPHARVSRIVEHGQCISGRLSRDESRLLVELTLKVIAAYADTDQFTLIEIGGSSGQASVMMGLSLHESGCTHGQVVTVYAPDQEELTDRSSLPRERLYYHLIKYGLTDRVICAPEQEPAPWTRTSVLLLINNVASLSDTQSKLSQYIEQLAPEGLLLLQSAADHPAVESELHQWMSSSSFEPIAQVGKLVVLRLRSTKEQFK